MASAGEEPIGSMGTDTPLACLSDRPQSAVPLLQAALCPVTNPPIDPIREEMVMSLISYIGSERNILEEAPENCHMLKLEHPLLTIVSSRNCAASPIAICWRQLYRRCSTQAMASPD